MKKHVLLNAHLVSRYLSPDYLSYESVVTPSGYKDMSIVVELNFIANF